MLKNKLVSFTAKRVLIYCGILSIIDIILFRERWHILAGLLIGGVVSIAKLISYAWVFERIIAAASNNLRKAGSGKSIAVFVVNQLLLLPLLYIAYKLGIWIFIGFVAGILLVPFAIMINCITEAVGITKNNFE